MKNCGFTRMIFFVVLRAENLALQLISKKPNYQIIGIEGLLSFF